MNMYVVAFGWLLIVSVIIFYIRIKSKERLTMIEKGIDPNLENSKKYSHQLSLRNGIFLISAALGLLLGSFIKSFIPGIEFIAYASSVLLLSGIGLICYFLIVKKYL